MRKFLRDPKFGGARRGVALVMVLAIIVLILALAVGLLVRASLERTSAQSYRSSMEARSLADTAVSIAQAQINHAATALVDGEPAAWASQPGMVRVFKQDGALHRAYKLYSDKDMVTETLDLAVMRTGLDGWNANKAHFTDLNAPVRGNFPILDPSARDDVQGFRIESAPDVSPTQQAPMPVRWLYVLKDGQVKAPEGTGVTATVAGATKDNPIVGRIAFWTDDETCKLNINTASQGGFWDIPRAFTFEERDRMARFQPALREFQRYPGHPATTSLFPVLGYKFPTERAFADFLYGEGSNPGITPRVQRGGSFDGTQKATAPVTLDNARLYSSVDEILFNPDRGDNGTLAKEDLEKAKFFLTAQSRAPEVNLFHLPRMVAWPINTGTRKKPSALDKLIALCGTINGQPYYLKRSNPESPTEDYANIPSNRNLYAYIRRLMQRNVPGFGNTSFAQKFSQPEADQIETEIFDYIRSSNIFCTMLGADPFTPLTPPSDARSAMATPASKAGQVTPLEISGTKGFGRLPVISKAVLEFYTGGATSAAGSLPVIPQMSNTPTVALTPSMVLPGASSTPPVVGLPIQFQTRAILYFDTFDPMYGYPFPRYRFDAAVTLSGSWTVTRTGGGPSSITFAKNPATIQVRHDPLALYDAKTAESYGGRFEYGVWFGRYLGGPQGPLWLMQNYNGGVGSAFNQYPLVSNAINLLPPINTVSDGKTPPGPKLPDPATITDTFSFSGGKAEVKIRVGADVVQTYEFEFPPFSGKPVPLYAGPQTGDQNPPVADVAHTQLKQIVVSADFRQRLSGNPGVHRMTNNTAGDYAYCDLRLVQPNDVVVSLEPAYGDKRLLAGRKVLRTASSYTTGTRATADFVPHEDYFAATRHAHSLRTASFNTEVLPGPTETQPGRILNITYGRNASPDVPTRYHGGVPTFRAGGSAATFPPDFDNGTLHLPDDAYANRADEGSSTDLLTGTGSTGSGNSGRDFAWYQHDLTDYTLANTPTFYSPSKQMPSAAMFGSLPTGVVRDLPWQTLLFRPDPGGHPGAESPPDYLLLDLFWTPVVEPYAISEPFSTSGKVNLNYQILPFTYLKRESSLLGLFHSLELVSIANTDAYRGGTNGQFGAMDEYKMFNSGNSNDFSTKKFRVKVNAEETLKGFEERFKAGKIFLSETEICTLPLIPAGEAYSKNFENSYWDSRRLTGDNSREMPYVQLLPRVTTKSNTYTVHYRVQALKQRPSRTDGEWNQWRENTDLVTAEYRGSSTIERFVDPNNQNIPNYAENPNASPAFDSFYRWRTLSTRQFAP